MKWLDVDGARDYLIDAGNSGLHGRERRPARKVLYNMAADGMKVARLGGAGRRLMFCTQWIDEYLQQKATTVQPDSPIALALSRGAA